MCFAQMFDQIVCEVSGTGTKQDVSSLYPFAVYPPDVHWGPAARHKDPSLYKVEETNDVEGGM